LEEMRTKTILDEARANAIVEETKQKKAIREASTNAMLEETRAKIILDEAKTNAIVEEARTKAILEARTTAILEEAEANEAQIKAEVAKFYCMGYLLERGLPPLGKCQISRPGPRYIKQESFGKPVHRMDGELFAVLADVDLPRVRSPIWIQANGLDGDLSSLGSWYHVLCIQQKVDTALREVIRLTGLQGMQVDEIGMNLSTTHTIRADTLSLTMNGCIVGMCEVKVPSEKFSVARSEPTDDLISSGLNNQICNNLQLMRDYYGVQHPIGFVCTYNEWMVVWLAEADELARTSSTTHITNSTAAATATTNVRPALIGKSKQSVVLLCSRVYHRSDPELTRVLASALIKMARAPREQKQLQFDDRTRKYGKADVGGASTVLKLETLPFVRGQFPLHFEMPDKRSKSLFLIADYGGGADGKVWLACTSSGHLVVVKLSDSRLDKSGREHTYAEEAQAWRTVWHQRSVHTTTILGVDALLMPFTFTALCRCGQISFTALSHWNTATHEDVETIFESSASKVLDRDQFCSRYHDAWGVAAEAIRTMALRGFEHLDIRWRHVALLPQKQQRSDAWIVVPVLIDLNRTQPIDATNEKIVEECIQRGMARLTQEFHEKSSNRKI
jgi:hypothetical protein